MRESLRLPVVLIAALLLIGSFVSPVRAESDYPNRPVRLIVGFIPGSAADITARVLGNRLSSNPRPAIRHRNEAGRGLEPRRRGGGTRPEGRLHAVHRIVGQRHQCCHQSQPGVRHRQGLCPDRAHQHDRRHPGRAPFHRRQQPGGVDRARQIEAGGGSLRFDWRWYRAAYVR